MENCKRLILIGPPASGKGTQAHFLCNLFNVPTLSTGALLRKEIKSETEIGKQAKSYMDKGHFVPDTLVNDMVRGWIESLEDKRFLLDGYPRTLAQAEMLQDYMDTHLGGIDCVVWMDVSREIIENRIKHRVECPACHFITQGEIGKLCPQCATPMTARNDDALDKFVIRWADFEELTSPVIRYYLDKGLIVKVSVNSERPVEDVSAELLANLRSYFEAKRVLTQG